MVPRNHMRGTHMRGLSTLGLVAMLAVAGCGGGGGDGAPPPAVQPAATPPVITAPPASQSIATGQAVSFTVAASGSAPLAYQWRRGGAAIAGATAATFTIAAAQAADAGSYDVVVTNAAGSATSAAATLTVQATAIAILRQPADATAAAGYPITLTVTAAGTAPAYQWKRNGAVIAGATAASYRIDTVQAGDDQATFSVDISNSANTVSSRALRLSVLTLNPVQTSYVRFDGVTETLYAWEGRQTAVLTAARDRSYPTIAAILGAMDGAFAYYQSATGFTPGRGKQVNGKPTVAEVASTCGAGCGYLGAGGIEVQAPYFAWLYDGILASGEYDQTIFYEYGRNFWNYSPKIEYKTPDTGATVVTGFAIFMRFNAMEAIGVPGAPFNRTIPFATFRANIEQGVDLYEADPAATFDSTLRIGKAQANNPANISSADLFASFCLRMKRDLGGDAFVGRLWREVARRPDAATTQDAVDNFMVAASIAAGRNLTALFATRWRWPVSAAARAEMERLPA